MKSKEEPTVAASMAKEQEDATQDKVPPLRAKLGRSNTMSPPPTTSNIPRVPRGGSLRERHRSMDKDHPAHHNRHRRFSAHIVARRESMFERGASLDASIRRPSLASVAERGNWGNRWEFLLSCVGLSVGIGNVWRFPYLAYQNGGGAFLIPYIIMLALAGKPMYFLELAIGQFGGVGPIALWNCCPVMKGVGCAMVTVSLVVCIYYNVIMSYTLHYMGASLAAEVPWAKCDPEWADMETCYVRGGATNTNHSDNDPYPTTKHRETASLQYWERKVLALSSGIEDLGPIKWDLALCLFISWCIVVLCLVKGIKTSGKVVYFAATFPYVILLTLLVTGLLQPGAIDGVLFFILPTWSKLLDIQVWRAAAGQMFFSLSVSMGGLIMYSSYNDFRNNVYRDALVVSVLDTITSIISGMVTFSILGAMATDLGVPIDQVVKEGPGLAFVAYPEALLRLPCPQFWSVLFFLMLFVLGLDSEFALLENVLTSISDEFTWLRNHKLIFCVVTACFCYIVGLPCVTHGGNYVLTLMDVYGGGVGVLFIAIAECIGLLWIYGLGRIASDLEFMLGNRPNAYWRITWSFLAPVILLLIFLYSLVFHVPLRYEEYLYPSWANMIGWALACVSMLQIPIWAIYMIWKQPSGTLWEKMKMSARSTPEWGPSDSTLRADWVAFTQQNVPGTLLTEQRKDCNSTPINIGDKIGEPL
ncbi:sodium-dependent proline transporter-like [Neocloeon triangulifer]|uniref:sodium-dependent proline transporter-like n=1 Tax=Neocloeon triangulifer TaxID=2078957 RepID=UPI00286F1793|nr:sodium-dependent proline transporter-like [Neocloeon triangulifer]